MLRPKDFSSVTWTPSAIHTGTITSRCLSWELGKLQIRVQLSPIVVQGSILKHSFIPEVQECGGGGAEGEEGGRGKAQLSEPNANGPFKEGGRVSQRQHVLAGWLGGGISLQQQTRPANSVLTCCFKHNLCGSEGLRNSCLEPDAG